MRRWGTGLALALVLGAVCWVACEQGAGDEVSVGLPLEGGAGSGGGAGSSGDAAASGEAAAGGAGGGVVATGEGAGASDAGGDEVPARVIADYGPPAPTLLVIAGMKGYVEPCGCTAGLHVGGLERMAGFVEAVRARQPDSLVLDGGNMLFEYPEVDEHMLAQERIKAPLVAGTLGALGVFATTPGPTDFALGVDFYLETLGATGIRVLSANLLTADGEPLGAPFAVAEVGGSGLRVGVIGVAAPQAFAGVEAVRAEAPAPAIAAAVEALRADGVETIVLLVAGDAAAAAELAGAAAGVDFVVVGMPEETDEVAIASGAALLHAFDQGRYVGILKLYPGGDGAYADARVEDREALERIDRRLDYLRSQLFLLPPARQGEEPPIILSMREQMAELEVQREAVRNGNIAIPEGGGAFLYWPVALERGYPENPDVAGAVDAYNAQLRALHEAHTDIVPLGPDDIAYVGIEVCALCHQEAVDHWRTTLHSHAMQTLVDRGKEFDQDCVSCHVAGFMRPGGSVVANHNGLADVQCEACHGPGGAHIVEETRNQIVLDPDPAVCRECHHPDHSPMFNYDTYRPIILGPGHGG